MRTLTVPLLAAGILMIGCDSSTPTPTELKAPTAMSAVGQGNGVVHRVSVGSHDFFPPGVDANFSLIAIEHKDGSITGQWSDQFGHGNGGYHIAVDCLEVFGNQAWISGILTQGPDAFIGRRFATRVRDNGTSANDPPDQISFSFGPFPIAPAFDCHTRPNFPLFPLDGGEVKVD